MKRIYLIILFIILLLVAFFLPLFDPQINPPQSIELNSLSQLRLTQEQVSQYDAVLIEFTDFNCPYCEQAQPTVDEIKERYPNVFVTVRHFPIKNSFEKSVSYECSSGSQPTSIFFETNYPQQLCDEGRAIVTFDAQFAQEYELKGTPAFLLIATNNISQNALFYGLPTPIQIQTTLLSFN